MTDAFSPIILNTIEQGVVPKAGSIYWTGNVDPNTEVEFGKSYLRSAWPAVESKFQSELPSIHFKNTTSGVPFTGTFNMSNGFPFVIASNGQTMAVDYLGNVAHSSNFGASWSPAYQYKRPTDNTVVNLNSDYARGLIWHKNAFYMLYVNSSTRFELVKSTDGTNWTNVNTNIPFTNVSGYESSMLQTIIRSDGESLYLASLYAGATYRLAFIRSDDNGVNWTGVLKTPTRFTLPVAGYSANNGAGNSLPYMDGELIAYANAITQDYATSGIGFSRVTLCVSRDKGVSFTEYEVPLARTTPMFCLSNIVRLGGKLVFGCFGGIDGAVEGQLNVFNPDTNNFTVHSSGITAEGKELSPYSSLSGYGSISAYLRPVGGRILYNVTVGGIGNLTNNCYTFVDTTPDGLTSDPSSTMFKASITEFGWTSYNQYYTFTNNTRTPRYTYPYRNYDWKDVPKTVEVFVHDNKAYSMFRANSAPDGTLCIACHDFGSLAQTFITPNVTASARPATFSASSPPYNNMKNTGLSLVMKGK